MADTTHLVALQTRLAHEVARLDAARTERERCIRAAWVAGLQREIAGERAFLGMPPEAALPTMSEDELLAELMQPAFPSPAEEGR